MQTNDSPAHDPSGVMQQTSGVSLGKQKITVAARTSAPKGLTANAREAITSALTASLRVLLPAHKPQSVRHTERGIEGYSSPATGI